MLKSLLESLTTSRDRLRIEHRSCEFVKLDPNEIALLIGLIENDIKGEAKAVNKKDTVLDGTEHKSDFHPTVDYMLSADYKKRLVAEYLQTKIRYEKLKSFCNRIEAAHIMNARKEQSAVQMPKHDVPYDILREQQKVMGEYLHILEIRAEIEHIDLNNYPI